MTTAELAARANQRAHDRRIHVMRVPGRCGVYQVSSLSEPGTKRIVTDIAGEQACSCRGFYYRKNCAHVEALRNRLARERRL